MGIKCGIVGLTERRQVDTLQRADTRADRGRELPVLHDRSECRVVPVPDPRLARLAAIASPEKILPATVEFVDIAGIVQGPRRARPRQQFLANIREVDAIAHVVRCFVNDDVVHVAGRVDPLADIARSIPSSRSRISRPR